MYSLRRKPSPAFATRIMGRRLATHADITLRGTLAAISSLAFSLACSVSLCGLWRALQPTCARLTRLPRLAAGDGNADGRPKRVFFCEGASFLETLIEQSIAGYFTTCLAMSAVSLPARTRNPLPRQRLYLHFLRFWRSSHKRLEPGPWPNWLPSL